MNTDENLNSNDGWEYTVLHTPEEVFDKLAKLRLFRTPWIFRGQSTHKALYPNVDRIFQEKLFKEQNENDVRAAKLSIERQIVERFRTALKSTDEEKQKIYLAPTVETLMLIQHYGGPTRLVDWSLSPYIAAYFAVCNSYTDKEDGEIWAFDYDQYVIEGTKQWEKYPETKIDGKFDNNLTKAFEQNYQNNWIVCQFLNYPFPRIEAQEGLFTFCPQFGTNHAYQIKYLLKSPEHFHRYVIKGCNDNKKVIRSLLRDIFGIWKGQIYPDLTGVSTGLTEILNDKGFSCHLK